MFWIINVLLTIFCVSCASIGSLWKDNNRNIKYNKNPQCPPWSKFKSSPILASSFAHSNSQVSSPSRLTEIFFHSFDLQSQSYRCQLWLKGSEAGALTLLVPNSSEINIANLPSKLRWARWHPTLNRNRLRKIHFTIQSLTWQAP